MFYVLPNPQAIAEYVSDLLIAQIQKKNNAVLGLATGSTMEPVYEKLSKQVTHKNIDVSGLTTFNLDEYIGLGAEHPQSYRYFMQQHLFNRLAFARHRTFLPDGLCNDLTEQCEQYSNQIRQSGYIDLQLLGIGNNGHIGFNEPGTPFNSRTHVVTLSEQTRLDNSRFFDSMNEVPDKAITLGLQDIMESRQIILIATGVKKAEIMAELYESPVNEQLPASVIKSHPNAMILLDEQAAMYLPDNMRKAVGA
ncbi:MAG: glucosamine-6-phosphate deaminase [Alcaligenaceae bacterium]|nr:glucosamine-6-phosphate deaminase [Alcaligenaceae bacterium]